MAEPRVSRRVMSKPDSLCAKAVDLARDALVGVAERGTVGDHVRVVASGERLVTHAFTCTAKGYRGWEWAVSLARSPRAKVATVCEVVLLAGEGAITSADHVPWEQRLRPGDLGAGDVLARRDDDPRLIGGFEATGEDDVDAVALDELGLGRPRVLSALGRGVAADRWQDGDFGPDSEVARAAPARCASCGFMMPVTGALRPVFGLCANEWSPADGRVVSLGYGCGAHSEAVVERPPHTVLTPVIDDFGLDVLPLADPPARGESEESRGESEETGEPADQTEGHTGPTHRAAESET